MSEKYDIIRVLMIGVYTNIQFYPNMIQREGCYQYTYIQGSS